MVRAEPATWEALREYRRGRRREQHHVRLDVPRFTPSYACGCCRTLSLSFCLPLKFSATRPGRTRREENIVDRADILVVCRRELRLAAQHVPVRARQVQVVAQHRRAWHCGVVECQRRIAERGRNLVNLPRLGRLVQGAAPCPAAVDAPRPVPCNLPRHRPPVPLHKIEQAVGQKIVHPAERRRVPVAAHDHRNCPATRLPRDPIDQHSDLTQLDVSSLRIKQHVDVGHDHLHRRWPRRPPRCRGNRHPQPVDLRDVIPQIQPRKDDLFRSQRLPSKHVCLPEHRQPVWPTVRPLQKPTNVAVHGQLLLQIGVMIHLLHTHDRRRPMCHLLCQQLHPILPRQTRRRNTRIQLGPVLARVRIRQHIVRHNAYS